MNVHVSSLFTLCLLASAAQAEVISIANEAAFDREINKSGKFAVVKFAAEWCGVCKGVKQPFQDLSTEAAFKDVLFANVNIDEAGALANKHEVVGVPTFVFISQGKKVGKEVGVQDTKTFKEDMRAHITNYSSKNVQTSVDASDATKAGDESVAVEPDKEEVAGIVNSIVKAVKLVIAVIIGLVQYSVNAIKGLFSR